MSSNLRRLLAASAAALNILAASPALAAPAKTFTVVLNNVSTDAALRLPDGSMTNVAIAPGAYAVIAKGAVVFQPGSRASRALEMLAEDGDPKAFVAQLRKMKGVRSAGMVMPFEPISFTARPGDRLVFAAMFAQSNDLFYAPAAGGIALFDKSGKARSGDIADPITLWDAGTEVNEAPGAGPNQPARQAQAGAGVKEDDVIQPVHDAFTYPATTDVLSVSLTAR